MDIPTEPIVAFYLVERTARDSPCLPVKSSVLTKALNCGNPPGEDPGIAWKVTFDRNSTLQTPVRLLDFGTDPRCSVVLSGPSISPFHCRVYAQLNSGHNMMVIEDSSVLGTSFHHNNGACASTKIQISQRRVYAEGLSALSVGPYNFGIELPHQEAERAEARRWFLDHEPEPVTESMLKTQLKGHEPDFRELCQVGRGGNGKVYRFVEQRTGLLIGVKKQLECSNKYAEREIKCMMALQSPLLAHYLHSRPVTKDSALEWWTYMPLYQGNLTSMLPQPLEVLDHVMLRMLEAVSFIHGKGALHQDIKPENFFVLRKQPLEVVLGDFGHTISLQDHGLLMGDCGTDGFAAPERLLQRHTTALDIYSLGVSFFVMLEFEKVKNMEWKKFLGNVAQHPPRIYGGLIKRMTATDPKNRPSMRECIDAIRGKQYTWGQPTTLVRPVEKVCRPNYGHNPRPLPQALAGDMRAEPVDGVHTGRRRSSGKINAPSVDTDPPRKGLNQPAKVAIHHNTFAHLNTKKGTAPPKLAVHGREQKEKATTYHNIFAHLNTNGRTAFPVPVVQRREHKEKATNRHHTNTNPKPNPPAPVVHRREHRENVLRPHVQHAQNSNRIARPNPNPRHRIGTRDQLRRGPIRKANIERAFAIGQRLTRIRDTTTTMAKCLYHLGAGIVTNACDITLLGVDVFKLCKDVGRARRVIKHIGPGASIKLGDATWLAAGMKSKGLCFVSPAEYERERMVSTQLGKGAKELHVLETVHEVKQVLTT